MEWTKWYFNSHKLWLLPVLSKLKMWINFLVLEKTGDTDWICPSIDTESNRIQYAGSLYILHWIYVFKIKDGMQQIHATSIWRLVSTVTCLQGSFSIKSLFYENGLAINYGLWNSDFNFLGLINCTSPPCIHITDKFHTCNESVSLFLLKPMTLHMDVQCSALCLLS